jgi:hypothetical protein
MALNSQMQSYSSAHNKRKQHTNQHLQRTVLCILLACVTSNNLNLVFTENRDGALSLCPTQIFSQNAFSYKVQILDLSIPQLCFRQTEYSCGAYGWKMYRPKTKCVLNHSQIRRHHKMSYQWYILCSSGETCQTAVNHNLMTFSSYVGSKVRNINFNVIDIAYLIPCHFMLASRSVKPSLIPLPPSPNKVSLVHFYHSITVHFWITNCSNICNFPYAQSFSVFHQLKNSPIVLS